MKILYRYRLHILIWSVFICYETVIVGLAFNAWSHPITYVAHYLLAILLFYFHADLALPWIANGSKWLILPRALLLVGAELGVYIVGSYYIDVFLIREGFIKHPGLTLSTKYALKSGYREIYLMGLASGFYFIHNYIIEKRKAAELEKQRLKDIIAQQVAEHELINAQNAHLKAQINPHFLFNTLDFIYHKANDGSPELGEAILLLADMMRFAIAGERSAGLVELTEEVEQVQRLIQLYALKKGSQPPLTLRYDEDELTGIKVIPLVLLTLAENVLKHGDLERPALILIQKHADTVEMTTLNKCAALAPSRSGRQGTANILKRLAYSYSAAASYHAGMTEGGDFKASVIIPLNVLPMPNVSLGV